MLEIKNHPVSAAAASHSHLNKEQYAEMYKRSIENPEKFWSEQAEEFIHWHAPWKQVFSSDFHTAKTSWFSGAKLNVSYNCIDRHLEKRGGQTAIIWEGDEPDHDLKVS